ncbi:MAG TPA: hypothetical protein VGJ56_24285 [Reyranella sp.]|jgi:hypothetical protein
MVRPVSALLLTAVFVAASASAFAQSSPIPDSPVPGIGGRAIQPGSIGSSPGTSGSAIGSNVGAGASASPVTGGDGTQAPDIAQAPTRPLIGLSRDLPAPPPPATTRPPTTR